MGNTVDNIMDSCSEIPEFTIIKGPNAAKLILDSKDGAGEELFATVFPGMTLGYIDIGASSCPDAAPTEERLLRINYCMSGRAEMKMDNGSYFYVQEKELTVSRSAEGAYYFPRGYYRGIVIYLDRRELGAGPERLFSRMGVDLDRLDGLASGGNNAGVYRVSETQEVACAWLWRLRSEGELCDLRLALLVLLRLLCRGVRQEQRGQFFTAEQVRVAKQAEALLTGNLDRHIPVKALAEYFGVGGTALRKCFKGVYGRNISDYVRTKRMLAAAALLEEGDEPISEIAMRVGYTNQGKFAEAFRAQFGIAPSEYRRLRRRSR